MSQLPDQQPRVLLSGLAYVESPRWHEGRLWFAHWGAGEIVAVDLDGNSEVVGEGPAGLGWSIDWLPDGRLLVTGPGLMRREPDGRMVAHADMSTVAAHRWNEIVVDGRGNIYVNGMGFDFLGGEPPKPGVIALVTPDGAVQQVADSIEFPNGMAVTPDNTTLIVAESFARRLTAFDIAVDGTLSNRRVWADGVGPDGICIDAEGAVWTQSATTRTHTGRAEDPEGEVIRVREGGRILESYLLDRAGFACMLGGPQRRTLFILANEWRGIENVDAAIASRSGQVLVVGAPAPGVGWP
ncbi:MAG: SMP-30/gluconolactonase/LRE family protein [Frankiaceae bacterium]